MTLPRLRISGLCALARSLKALLRGLGPLRQSNLSYTLYLRVRDLEGDDVTDIALHRPS